MGLIFYRGEIKNYDEKTVRALDREKFAKIRFIKMRLKNGLMIYLRP